MKADPGSYQGVVGLQWREGEQTHYSELRVQGETGAEVVRRAAEEVDAWALLALDGRETHVTVSVTVIRGGGA